MEGELWKWTNYWNGWQSRWFMLSQDGVLSYYKSKDEVDQGFKGSMSVAACEIVVHSTDKTRLDIVVSNEQYLYLRSLNEKERQKWLIALGSAKASISNTTRARRSLSHDHEVVESLEVTDAIKAKRSELRLYCDLLMQQIHTVKMAVSDKEENRPEESRLDEGSKLLTQTCDTFINALDETMGLVEHSINSSTRLRVGDANHLVHRSARNSVTSLDRSPTPQFLGGNSKFRHRQSSSESINSASRISPVVENGPELVANGFKSLFGGDPLTSSALKSDNEETGKACFPLEPSFPSSISKDWIPAFRFISACQGAIRIFDILGSSGFIPIRLEIGGNIAKINTKIASNSKRFENLFSVIEDEIKDGLANHTNSACTALLWLIKYLMFIHGFLTSLLVSLTSTDFDDDRFIKDSLATSYEAVLGKHHSSVIHNVFSIALQTSPTRTAFMRSMTESSDGDFHHNLAQYLEEMEKCLQVLSNHMDKQNLLLKLEAKTKT